MVTHRLPDDTRDRVKRSLGALGRFPQLGVLLERGGWEGFRFVLGPWRWMVVVYDYDKDADRVVIATVQDGRSASSPRAED